MKKQAFLFIFLLNALFVFSQVKFVPVTYHLGTFSEDTVRLPAFHFEYINLSKRPIHIARIQTSCGCIQTSTDFHPIKPNEKGIIQVVYNPDGHPGMFKRSITVYFSNMKEPYTLYVEGYVRPKKKRTALNSSF